MKNTTSKPKDAVAPFFLISGNVPVASPDGVNGWRFDSVPPKRFPLSSAADDGREVSWEEFLTACKQ